MSEASELYTNELKRVQDELAETKRKLEAAEQRISLLEHDMKSGTYETLYAQTVDDLTVSVQRITELEQRIRESQEQEQLTHVIADANGLEVWAKLRKPLYAIPPIPNTDKE